MQKDIIDWCTGLHSSLNLTFVSYTRNRISHMYAMILKAMCSTFKLRRRGSKWSRGAEAAR
jgi:hypothetical protein